MNEQDNAAFEEWQASKGENIFFPHEVWQAALEYAAEKAARAEPVVNGPGFWLSAEYINELVINSLKDLIRRAKWCSVCDVDLRENGKHVRFEADWIKYMEWRDTHPPQPVAYRVTVNFMGKTREFFTDLYNVAETLKEHREGFIQPLYIAPPAVAVNEQLLEALRAVTTAVDLTAYGMALHNARAAIAAAEAAKGGV